MQPHERLRNSINIRVNDAEYEELAQRAKGEPVSAYVRRLIVRHLRRRK